MKDGHKEFRKPEKGEGGKGGGGEKEEHETD